MNIRRWNRGQVRPLSMHFSAKEFNCTCGTCVGQFVDQDLITKLEEVRQIYNGPITITSGFRCKIRQQQLRVEGRETSTGTSTHELGQAADITASDMDRLKVAVDLVFDTFGVAKSFIHVDLRPKLPNGLKRIWYYKK